MLDIRYGRDDLSMTATLKRLERAEPLAGITNGHSFTGSPAGARAAA